MTDKLYYEARYFLACSLQNKEQIRETLHPWRKAWQFTYHHSLRVEALAFQLLADQHHSLSAEEQQTLHLSAILHDVARLDDPPNHAALSAEITAGWLRDNPALAAQVVQPARVLDLIARHSNKNQPEPDDLTCALLKDADLLDEIGAVSIFMSASWVDRNSPYFFYDLRERLQTFEMDYCTRILTRLNTPAARTYLEQKQDFIKSFIHQLDIELLGVPRDIPNFETENQALSGRE